MILRKNHIHPKRKAIWLKNKKLKAATNFGAEAPSSGILK
jgi:hypothetical protein